MNITVALVLGFVGSLHCVGMCGGLQAIFNLPKTTQAPGRYYYGFLLLNLGRISLYATAGAVFGWLGTQIGESLNILDWSIVLRQMTGVIVFLIGLQLLYPQFSPLQVFEKSGYRLWRRLKPLMNMLPQEGPVGMFLRGVLWGFLPCGLVYSALVVATASGSFIEGGLTMLAFGLGTLPALVASGYIWLQFKHLTQTWLLKSGAVFLLVTGLVIVVPTLIGHGPHHIDSAQKTDHSGHEHH